MKKESQSDIRLIVTDDGSHSLYHENLHETYHSTHGAMRESQHVFIQHGFDIFKGKTSPLRILEVGFGTGLNAWLSCKSAILHSVQVEFTTLEPFPLSNEIIDKLNYGSGNADDESLLTAIHAAEWNAVVSIHPSFKVKKMKKTLQEFHTETGFDLIYYDAFGPPAQPEMWTLEILQRTFHLLNPNGVLVTYCAKGQVRRDFQACGFTVERLPGPPGKREMLRAIKN